jgi:hypothetical protein
MPAAHKLARPTGGAMKKSCHTASHATRFQRYTSLRLFRHGHRPDQGNVIMCNSAKRFIPICLLLLLLVPGSALGQSGNDNSYYGYLSGGAGVSSGGTGLLTVAGGGEIFVHRRLTIGGELAAIAPPTDLGSTIGIISPNISWHFRPGRSTGRLEPFVTGGYSLFFRNGALSGLNFGGGAIWWVSEGVGLRLEARDHVPVMELDRHIVLFRAGITFR